MKDSDLIEQIRENNVAAGERALRMIYKDCYPMIESMVLKNSGSKEDAKDNFQESMIIFYNKVKSDGFELNSKISTFLFSISRNQWFKKIRDSKKAKTEELPDKTSFTNGHNVHKLIEFKESQILLAELLEKSGQKCVTLLKSFYFEKITMRKLAEMFGYASEQVAKNQKVRCLKKIRSIMLQNKEYQEHLTNIF